MRRARTVVILHLIFQLVSLALIILRNDRRFALALLSMTGDTLRSLKIKPALTDHTLFSSMNVIPSLANNNNSRNTVYALGLRTPGQSSVLIEFDTSAQCCRPTTGSDPISTLPYRSIAYLDTCVEFCFSGGMEWHEHDNVTQIRDVKMNQSPSASGYRGESIYCFSAHDDVAEVYDIPLNRPSHVHSFRRRVVKQRDDWLKIYQGNMCTTLRPILCS